MQIMRTAAGEAMLDGTNNKENVMEEKDRFVLSKTGIGLLEERLEQYNKTAGNYQMSLRINQDITGHCLIVTFDNVAEGPMPQLAERVFIDKDLCETHRSVSLHDATYKVHDVESVCLEVVFTTEYYSIATKADSQNQVAKTRFFITPGSPVPPFRPNIYLIDQAGLVLWNFLRFAEVPI